VKLQPDTACTPPNVLWTSSISRSVAGAAGLIVMSIQSKRLRPALARIGEPDNPNPAVGTPTLNWLAPLRI
jgi:hypothetical protein